MRVKQQPAHRDISHRRSLVDYTPSQSQTSQSQSYYGVGNSLKTGQSNVETARNVNVPRMNDSVWSQGTNGMTNQLYISTYSQRSDDAELSSRISGGQPRFGKKRIQTIPSPMQKKRRPSKLYRPSKNVLKEIRHYQKSVHMLIPKAPFVRLVKEVMSSVSNQSHRIHVNAITALQEACEAFLVSLFEAANLASAHAKRVTLMVPDIQLVRRILSMFNAGV